MKKLITCSDKYESHFTYIRSGQKFSVYITYLEPFVRLQVSEIHPYDDADYMWAMMEEDGLVKFIKDRQVIDDMQMQDYDADDYESFNDYIDDVVDKICLRLREFNRSVESRILYD